MVNGKNTQFMIFTNKTQKKNKAPSSDAPQFGQIDTNLVVLQFFTNKAIRQLIKSQSELEWFFVEILFVSVAKSDKQELTNFHNTFLRSLIGLVTYLCVCVCACVCMYIFLCALFFISTVNSFEMQKLWDNKTN